LQNLRFWEPFLGSAKLENDRRDLIAQGTSLIILDDALSLQSVAFCGGSLVKSLLRGGPAFFRIAIHFWASRGRHVPVDSRRRLPQYSFESARRAAVDNQFAEPRTPFLAVHGRPIAFQVARQFLNLWLRNCLLCAVKLGLFLFATFF
jgi:hypothetical protein